jgi:hypothetical protein
MGIVVTIVSIIVSLIPPGDVRSVWLFEFKLLAGCAVLIVAARIMFKVALRRRDGAS